jgi:four helix bundle protein
MNPEEFKARTKAFGVRVYKLVVSLQQPQHGQVLGRQLLRAGTSVGANYRAACRARSPADFVAKMKIVEEECDESLYWIELLCELGLVKSDLLAGLTAEGNELLALIVASIKTARSKTN